MRYLILTIAFILQLSTGTYAQTDNFSKIIDFFPLNGELGYEIYNASDGYLLLIRNDCINYPNSNECTTLIKINYDGEVMWMTELDLITGWFGSIIDENQTYYVGGFKDDTVSDMQIAKISHDGELLWQKKYTHVSLSSGARTLMFASDIEIAISSGRDRPDLGFGRLESYLMFCDLEGNLIDTIFFNADFRWSVTYKVVRSTKDTYLVPFIYCPIGNCTDYLPAGLVSIDRKKGVEWRTLWPDGWFPYINAVEQTDSNIITVIYQTRDYALPLDLQAPPSIFYLDTSGQILDSIVLWSNHLNQVRNTQGYWQDGIVACGQQYLNAESNNKGPYFGWMFRVDENKEVLWQRSYTDTTYEGLNARFNHIKQTPDGGFILIGTIDNKMTGVNESHVWLMKVDSNGCLSPDCEEYNFITDIEPVAFPSGVALQLYPNPAGAQTTLSLPPDVPDHDLLATLVSSIGKVLKQQTYQHPGIQFNTSDLPSGMYYVTVHRKGSLAGVEKLVVK